MPGRVGGRGKAHPRHDEICGESPQREPEGRPTRMTSRRIGLIGTASRVAVGVGLLILSLIQERGGTLTWGIQVHEAVLGLVVFPVVMVAIVLVARRSSDGPIRFTGSGGLLINCVVLVALFSLAYTLGAAALFYGASLLVAAWRGLPGCEATVLPNLLLGRDDQIGLGSNGYPSLSALPIHWYPNWYPWRVGIDGN